MVTTISPSVFLSKRESRLRDERASKDPEDMSFAHAVSGNSLHNFVLENLFVDNEVAGVGRTPWRSMGERHGVGIRRAPSTSLGISPADSHPSTRKPRVPGAPANARKTAQLRLALPFLKLRVVRAQEARGILVFSQTETLPNIG